MVKKIGLTGSIGTGKSTVLNIFKSLGVNTISADEIVHKLLEEENIKEKILKHFGKDILQEGKINRKKLASIVFENPEKRKILESILHPLVFEYIQNWFENIKDEKIAIAEVPLMIETGSYKHYDKIIVVYAPKEIQLKRCLKKGLTEEEAIKRINAQMDIEEKIKYADYIIENTKDLEYLQKQVKDVYQKILSDC
ncbi:dephospho-CoA kinase [Venenivibrio stagnispumantis]|uniref:Dephospho-CoA kinase n=1 Tax=Venenivibrio stagnispumantis TaxID=407998 RepID=A0AA46ADN8_9AQUI|nr:dephospho-CoA kinase [Venenivibrio stagnispumantis]MCW4573477.1 dephospho-CoA kinase [Venenivibrio stagnispumantis]SMP06776.1 dephospho-CoA kinase [Venenivibrio stagnispumantis]